MSRKPEFGFLVAALSLVVLALGWVMALVPLGVFPVVVGDDGGYEMGAMAWSYAAAIHLGISPSVVFHDAGYRGEARTLVENFGAGRYLGVPMLEWLGLTATGKNAKALGVQSYPKMLRWLRDE